jgi:hypothetical protein
MILGFLLTNTPKQAIFGTLLAAVPFTIIGALLPDFSYPWLNYFAYSVGHFFLIVTLVTIWQKKTALTIAFTPTHNKRLLISAFVCSCAGDAWRSPFTFDVNQHFFHFVNSA